MLSIIPFAFIVFPIVYCVIFFLMADSDELKYYSLVFLLLGNFLCTLDANLSINAETSDLTFFLGILFLMIGISQCILFLKSKKNS